MTSCKSAGNLLVKTMAIAAGLVLSLTVEAKTTTWKGGAEGDFATAGNWTDGAPESGDTVVFAGSDAVKITGSFDIGASGITLDNAAATVNSYVAFSGEGKFVKTGAGDLEIHALSSFSGGSRVENGRLVIKNDFSVPNSGYQRFGTGEIELWRFSDSVPTLWYRGAGYQTFQNDIRITGAITRGDGAIRCDGQTAFIDGNITADSDFLITAPGGVAGPKIRGSISAPGHTVMLFPVCNTNYQFPYISLDGTVNASVKKTSPDLSYSWQGGSDLRISGRCVGIDHAIVNAWLGNLVLEASAVVEGRTITVDGTNAKAKGKTCVLQINSEDNLSKLATVNLVSDGKLDIAAGVACQVSALNIDGRPQPEGTYTKSERPNSISGEGSITVAKLKYWTGGAEGSISDAANWSDKLAPTDGDVLSFLPGEKVTLSGGYEIADGQTLTIDNQCAIDDCVAFTGAGKLVIRGSGDFNVKARAWHSGGTRVDNGLFYFGDNSVTSPWSQYQTCFGSSEIELVRYSDSRPTLYLNVGRQLINPVRITGAITRGNGALKCGNPNSVFLSTVTADSDFLINCGYGGVTFNKDVSAPGHKVYCVSSTGGGGVDAIQFNGNVDADIVKERGWDLGVTGEPDNNWSGSWTVKLTGVSTNENRLLDVEWRTAIVLADTASWAGDVRVDGAKAARWEKDDTTLQIKSRANLQKSAVVNLLNGGKLDIAAGVNAKVAELYVDGQRQPDGVYTAASRPAAIAGEGRLTVGRMGLFFIVK